MGDGRSQTWVVVVCTAALEPPGVPCVTPAPQASLQLAGCRLLSRGVLAVGCTVRRNGLRA